MMSRLNFVGSQPIRKRRLTISEPNPLPAHVVQKIKQRNFFENMDSSQVQIRRPANGHMFVDRSDARGCNEGNSRGQFEAGVAAPAPPENLNWGSSFGSSFSQDVLQKNPNPTCFPTMEEAYYRPVQDPQPRMDVERSVNEPRFGNSHPRMDMEPRFGNSHPRMDMERSVNEPRFDDGHPRMDMERSLDEPGFANSHPRMDMEPRLGNGHRRMDMECSMHKPHLRLNYDHHKNYDPRLGSYHTRDEGSNANGYQRFESDALEAPSKFKTGRAGLERQELGHNHGGHNHGGAPRILDKMFTIGGFKMPFVTNVLKEPHASETKSYAARFFKKSPDYIIRTKPAKEVPVVQHIYNDMMYLADLYDDTQGRLRGLSVSRFRDSLSAEWTKIYRGRNYRTWEGWWKDFRNIDVDINEQLSNFDGFNVKYNFMMPECDAPGAELIKMAIIALQKNCKNYLGNLKIVYTMMDRNVLANLSMEATARLQDIIRSVPNHLWIFKLRCMVYVWYNYSQVMKFKDTGDRKYQMVLKEWQSPVIHWITKQAFLELKSISKSEFPQYRQHFEADKNN